MIRKISASAPSFKALEFGPGLNILLADKREGATEKDSRNGAGKTSLVELIHFLFGANASPKSIFRSDALLHWRFEAELDVRGQLAKAMRTGTQASRVEVAGALLPTPTTPQPRLLDGPTKVRLTLDRWKALLTAQWFNLEPATDEEDARFQPGFRSLFSYFARRERSGGFQDPMQHSTEQQTWDRQVCISWLLGLDWTVAQRFQRLREREKQVRTLKAAAKSGALAQFAGEAADLRTALTLSSAKAQRMKKRAEEFRVLPDYEDLEAEADQITGRINELSGEDLADRGLLRELQTSLREEADPGHGDVRKVFDEAGIVLPQLAQRRFDEVDRFHRKVLENRRAHLTAEIKSAGERISNREREKRGQDARRRQIMGVLKSGGALAEYTALREEAGRVEAQTEALRQRLQDVERLESLQTEIRAERARLKRELQEDIRERDERVQEAILRFEELSESLYEHPGSLTIGAGDSGPEFDVKIPSGQSRGIKNMQIFCFDLMLMELQAQRGTSQRFLIHDSHLFDGVDERQIARALQLGARRAEANGFQYIVTLNTDDLPREGFDSGFAVEEHFMDVRLTDASESGGLFGLRFDWPRSSSGVVPPSTNGANAGLLDRA